MIKPGSLLQPVILLPVVWLIAMPAVAQNSMADGLSGTVKGAAFFMLVMGLSMGTIWTIDLSKGLLKEGLFRAKENGVLFWPHVFAEYLTAALLIVAASAYFIGASWALLIALPALGALAYTSLNSLNWALAERSRLPYVIPMLAGLIGSVVSILLLTAAG